MAAAFGTKPVIVLATAQVVLHAHPRPVEQGVASPNVATPAYHYGRSFATLPRYRCHAGVSLQPMVISFRDQVRSFGEERGSYNTADAWQREEHLHIRRNCDSPVALSFIEHAFDARCQRRSLLMKELEVG